MPIGRQIIMLLSFIVVVFLLAALDNTAAAWLNAGDALVSVGMGTALFVMILRQKIDINLAFSLLLVYLVGYTFLREWLFTGHLQVISNQMKPVYESYLKRFPNLKLTEVSIATVQNIVLTYQAAIFGSMQIAGTFFGLMLFNNTSTIKLPVRFIRLPYVFVYPMIAAIALFLYPVTKTVGINLLICMGMIYLIQGTAVLSHAWGDFFSRARLLRTLLIMAIILNYPVMILISFIGIFDVWFDFRKLTIKEDKL